MSLTTSRRHALAAAAATLGAALLGGPALAQATYPSQPLKLIVPYPAGGATDTLARMVRQAAGGLGTDGGD
jgi:tripartite-type tricarboxylate transporter receptor subunit TctC